MLTHAWYLQNNHIFSYKTTFSFLHHSLFCVFSTYPACSENIFTHKISGEKKTIEGTPHTSVSTVYFLKCQISIYWNIGMLCWAEVKMLPDNLLQQQVFINTQNVIGSDLWLLVPLNVKVKVKVSNFIPT